MLDPRVDRLAQVLIRHSLKIQPGEKVLLESFDVPSEVVAAIVGAIGEAGALPLVETRQVRVLRALYRSATETQMRLIGEMELARMQRVDAYIGLRGAENSTELSDVPPEQIRYYQRHWWKPVHTEQRISHTRWVVLRWPTPSMAQAAGMSRDAFESFYFDACTMDYGRLTKAMEPLARRMEATRSVRIVGPGTDLRFSIDGIPVIPCGGDRNIPDGECFTAPVRDSVEGTIQFNAPALYQGKPFEKIRLAFQRGKIVEATASDTPGLNAILDSDEGARYVGEFSLGFHPFILNPMRDTLFDEKIAGSLHFTPGNAYEVADNGNRSEVHWDMVLIQRPEYGGGEIYFDETLVRKDGRFVVAELEGLNPENLTMKITKVESFPVWGGGRNYFFVQVETDEGITGVGEGGLTWQERATAEAVAQMTPMLVGQDPFRIEHLWQTMFRGGFFPAGKVVCSAISAIDIALWDIMGKALNVPVYQLLGGRVRDKVVCYPHTGGRTPEEFAENSKRLVEEGWKFIRFGLPSEGEILEPSRAVRQCVAQFAACREAVGEEIEICIDVHTRLDPQDTVALCRALEPYRPYFIEDPLRSESPAAFHALRRHIAAPLAAGEQFATKWEFRELIEEDLINYARIDLCIVGGISEARKIAGWCETHYIQIAPHNPLGPVSAAACLHLDLATSNFGVQEMPRRPGTSMTDVCPEQIEWADGYLLPPTRPGIGVEFDAAAARAHPYQANDAPRLRREDGSFTNW